MENGHGDIRKEGRPTNRRESTKTKIRKRLLSYLRVFGSYSLRRLSNLACSAASSAESPSACATLSLLATGVDCLIPVGASTS